MTLVTTAQHQKITTMHQRSLLSLRSNHHLLGCSWQTIETITALRWMLATCMAFSFNVLPSVYRMVICLFECLHFWKTNTSRAACRSIHGTTSHQQHCSTATLMQRNERFLGRSGCEPSCAASSRMPRSSIIAAMRLKRPSSARPSHQHRLLTEGSQSLARCRCFPGQP